jgi:lantibiotic modifying enzyme
MRIYRMVHVYKMRITKNVEKFLIKRVEFLRAHSFHHVFEIFLLESKVL